MNRLWTVPLLCLTVILAACQSAAAVPTVVPNPTRNHSTAQPLAASPPMQVTGLATPPTMPGCTMVGRPPAVSPTPPVPAVTEGDWQRGGEAAPMTVVEYCDFQSPYCAELAVIFTQLLQDFPDGLRFVYRHLIQQGVYDKSHLAIQYAEAAGKQGRFWQAYDLLYQHQAEWAALTGEEFVAWLSVQAVASGMDGEQYADDFGAETTLALVERARQEGLTYKLGSPPVLLINGEFQYTPLSYWSLATAVSLYQLQERQFSACPPWVIDPTETYTATLHTAKGEIVIRLFAAETPLAVNSFVFLARQGWYDGVTFHRVIPAVVAQSGDPSGSGLGGPGYAFVTEINPAMSFDAPGMVGLANAGRDSNGSQFFITLAAQPQLNGSHTLFGEVISGMEVVNHLTPRDPFEDPSLPPGDVITRVTILAGN